MLIEIDFKESFDFADNVINLEKLLSCNRDIVRTQWAYDESATSPRRNSSVTNDENTTSRKKERNERKERNILNHN